ncbi:hypothetical protein C5167_006400 [Papaver somniferum]|uniref:Uncharacterized protein n=1 Tax=Papaver somniferum TaxID=3469 RepID=A0A4Y7JD75_PAPSO|nr:hypothetical protein C5167_006400 [Papaver somniferum]
MSRSMESARFHWDQPGIILDVFMLKTMLPRRIIIQHGKLKCNKPPPDLTTFRVLAMVAPGARNSADYLSRGMEMAACGLR